jgi:two-component system, chemotaxis family, response regulator Rcp1
MIDATGCGAVHILLIEDNPGDVRLVIESLKDSKIRKHMSVVEDGEAAMAFLRREGQYSQALRPDLILLDFNLPKKNGREVLAELKADRDLGRIPVVVITSSNGEDDVRGAYDNHANCYVTKPVDLKQFVQVIRSIEEFWLSIARLPPQ